MLGGIPCENHKLECELQYAHAANTMHYTVLCFSLLPLLAPSSLCGKYLSNETYSNLVPGVEYFIFVTINPSQQLLRFIALKIQHIL